MKVFAYHKRYPRWQQGNTRGATVCTSHRQSTRAETLCLSRPAQTEPHSQQQHGLATRQLQTSINRTHASAIPPLHRPSNALKQFRRSDVSSSTGLGSVHTRMGYRF
jgi:hypothetical protein